jgi:hypothetical protein
VSPVSLNVAAPTACQVLALAGLSCPSVADPVAVAQAAVNDCLNNYTGICQSFLRDSQTNVQEAAAPALAALNDCLNNQYGLCQSTIRDSTRNVQAALATALATINDCQNNYTGTCQSLIRDSLNNAAGAIATAEAAVATAQAPINDCLNNQYGLCQSFIRDSTRNVETAVETVQDTIDDCQHNYTGVCQSFIRDSTNNVINALGTVQATLDDCQYNYTGLCQSFIRDSKNNVEDEVDSALGTINVTPVMDALNDCLYNTTGTCQSLIRDSTNNVEVAVAAAQAAVGSTGESVIRVLSECADAAGVDSGLPAAGTTLPGNPGALCATLIAAAGVLADTVADTVLACAEGRDATCQWVYEEAIAASEAVSDALAGCVSEETPACATALAAVRDGLVEAGACTTYVAGDPMDTPSDEGETEISSLCAAVADAIGNPGVPPVGVPPSVPWVSLGSDVGAFADVEVREGRLWLNFPTSLIGDADYQLLKQQDGALAPMPLQAGTSSDFLSGSSELRYVLRSQAQGETADELLIQYVPAIGNAPAAYYQLSRQDGLLIAWESSALAPAATISRDGELISVNATNMYADPTNEDAGGNYQVEVDPAASDSAVLFGFNLMPNQLREGTDTSNDWGDRLWSRFRYSTYIPDAYIPIPMYADWQCKGDEHAGDNRGFGFEGSSRTRFEWKVKWQTDSGQPTNSSTFRAATGVSKAYETRDGKRVLVATGHASPRGMRASPLTRSYDNSFTNVSIDHSVGNPLCHASVPNIDWEVDMTLSRDGYYRVEGHHDKAPNHEIYVQQGYEGTGWATRQVYTWYRESMRCLGTPGFCNWQDFSRNGTGPDAPPYET